MSELSTSIALFHREDIDNNSGKEFEVQGIRLFAVKKRDEIFIYHNRCPHAGLPLNWLPDQFLDLDKELIQCTSHGALFRIDSGQCVAGPCPGQYLRAVPFRTVDGEVRLDTQELHS